MKRYIWLIAVAMAIGFFLNSYEQRVVFGQAPDAATVTMKG